MEQDKQRIRWVDVLKFLGIWAIYIGHFEESPTLINFVFIYHIPLFFFTAGFFSSKGNGSIFDFIKKKTWQLMLPYAFFSILKLVFYTIQIILDVPEILDIAKSLALGVRNTPYVGSLWFIPCLYVMIIFDYIISKLFGNKKINLFISIGIFIFSQTPLMHNPITEPSWIFNIDSAMYYYIFYTLGNVLFPLLNKSMKTRLDKVGQATLIVLSVSITGIAYLFGMPWMMGHIIRILPFVNAHILFQDIFLILIILAIIYFNITVAKGFQRSNFMSNIGKETLILCGTEEILKISIIQILQIFDISVGLYTPFMVMIYALFCLIISYFTFIKILNRHFPYVIGKPIPKNKALPA